MIKYIYTSKINKNKLNFSIRMDISKRYTYTLSSAFKKIKKINEDLIFSNNKFNKIFSDSNTSLHEKINTPMEKTTRNLEKITDIIKNTDHNYYMENSDYKEFIDIIILISRKLKTNIEYVNFLYNDNNTKPIIYEIAEKQKFVPKCIESLKTISSCKINKEKYINNFLADKFNHLQISISNPNYKDSIFKEQYNLLNITQKIEFKKKMGYLNFVVEENGYNLINSCTL